MPVIRVKPLVLAVSAFLLVTLTTPTSSAEHPTVAKKRVAQRTTFTDAEIARGLLAVAFGAELGLAGRIDRIRKFVVPVRVFMDGGAQPDRKAELEDVIADIRRHIRDLDIAVTKNEAEANFVVRLVRERDLPRTARKTYGQAGWKQVRKLEPQCLSGFAKDEAYRIIRANVILVVDAGDFIFKDCAYEEMLQALGPIRDDDTVPWTMFNDDVQMGFFDIYDQHILNILYDPAVRPGMTRAEVRALLPVVLPRVRAWVASANGLPGTKP
jgi:hypothetical protein